MVFVVIYLLLKCEAISISLSLIEYMLFQIKDAMRFQIFIILFLCINIWDKPVSSYETCLDNGCLHVAFYNVENLFDTIDQPKIKDEDFTPQGYKHWNRGRYWSKINKLSQVLVSMGKWDGLDLIGLCEVENRQVIMDLIGHTSLKSFNYRLIHEDSKDRRGIDVALIYNPNKFQYVWHCVVPVALKDQHPTRDVLLVCGLVQNEKVIVAVNHWPSRWSGKLATEDKRISAAKVVGNAFLAIGDSLPNASCLIMGDFNDTPNDLSIKALNELLAKKYSVQNNYRLDKDSYVQGTIYHKEGNFGGWQKFDQIHYCVPHNRPLANWSGTHVFSPEWLLEKNGIRPFRTYKGPVYIGGFSDHLPVYGTLRF